MDKKENGKRDRKQNTALPDILIYHKKKYIVGYSLLLFLGILVLAGGITLYISVSVGGENPAEVLKEMLVPRNIVYLLPGFAILEIPVLLICGVLRIGERRFLRAYRGMPEEAKQKLFQLRARSPFLRGLGFYEAERTALLAGEERDSWLVRKKRTCAGGGGRQFSDSDCAGGGLWRLALHKQRRISVPEKYEAGGQMVCGGRIFQGLSGIQRRRGLQAGG